MSVPKKPNSSPSGPAAGGQPQRPQMAPALRWVWWAGMATAAGLEPIRLPGTEDSFPCTLSYSAFLEQVRSDNVASVNLAGQNAEGVFKTPYDPAAPTPAPAPVLPQRFRNRGRQPRLQTPTPGSLPSCR